MDSGLIQANSWNVLCFPILGELLSSIISFSNIKHPWKKAPLSKSGTRVLFLVLRTDLISESFLEVSSHGQGCPLHGYSVLCYVSDRLGVDNRVERTRYRVNYQDTYTKLFNRVNQEIVKGQTKHLIIMLGRLAPLRH